MTEFDGRCPFCRSENIEVEDSGNPAWGNNDEGDMIELWTCLDCNRQWNTESRVNVVHRKLELIIVCPYCGEDDKLESKPPIRPEAISYVCNRCNRDFAIHTEEYYMKETQGVKE